MKILALCGSLRKASINAATLRAAARLAPAGVVVEMLQGLGQLPLFNPDLEPQPPTRVVTFLASVARADALLIASPEYAHGVTGTIKNALDWLVGFEPFSGKPVAVLNTSPRSHHADDALHEILRTMNAAVVERACVALPLLGACLSEYGMVTDKAVSQALKEALSTLVQVITERRDHGGSLPLD